MALKKYILVIFLFISISAFTQDNAQYFLGIEYFKSGELDKAKDLFKELYKKNPNNIDYYNYLFQSYRGLKEYSDAEKLAKAQQKRIPGNYEFIIDEGIALKLAGKKSKSEDVFQKLISNLPASEGIVLSLYNSFNNKVEPEQALKALEKGLQLAPNSYAIRFQLADHYYSEKNAKMYIQYYLDLLEYFPQQAPQLQNALQTRITSEDDFDQMRLQLIKRIQKSPDFMPYNELLIWLYVQRKEFDAALLQAKSLFKRNREDGSRIVNLGRIAMNNEKYKEASSFFQFIVDVGRSNAYYSIAYSELLRAEKLQLTATTNPKRDSLLKLDKKFDAYFQEFGINAGNVELLKEFADLQSRYVDNLDKAILLLNKGIESPGLNKQTVAILKLNLGDVYLMKGEVWDAQLMYGQVDKSFKEDELGREGKFRNARLSFYKGEFDWAQAQLDVIKAATTQKISNDAIQLALLIQDNMGLDSNTLALELYAKADLFGYRNRFDSAIYNFNLLPVEFPNHSLTDESWFAIAKMYEKQNMFEKAIEQYEKVASVFSTDILADDALYRIALIYEFKLDNKEKAMKHYEKLILDYTDSSLAVDARKRFRKLRGDENSTEEQFNFVPLI